MTLRPDTLAIDPFEFPLKVGPVQRTLFDGNPTVRSPRKDGERHRPHRQVRTKFRHEARDLLIKQGGRVQESVLMLQRGIQRVSSEDPHD